MAWENDLQQFLQYVDDDVLVGLIESVLPIDRPILFIIFQDIRDDATDLCIDTFHKSVSVI